jgi:hypothetical protein
MEKRHFVKWGLIIPFIIAVAALGVGFSQKADLKNTLLTSTIKDTPAGVVDFRNFYGICWRGNAHENLAYARQMGYDYVFYQPGMENDPLASGMRFYLETPEYLIYDRVIEPNKQYTQKNIDFYENYCALKNGSGKFPFNLASGWSWAPKYNRVTVLLDFQQQKVIDWAIDSVLNYVKVIETHNPNFHFGGYAWDEPRPCGDFWNVTDKMRPVSLQAWTGADRGLLALAAHHDFDNYTDGHMSFYKQIYSRTKSLYPGSRFISEPFNIYDGWIKLIADRADAKIVTPDILSEEGPGTQFVDDSRIFSAGLIKKQNIYSTTPNVFDDKGNQLISAKAAINGAWFGWYGRFGGTGNMPDYKSITEVPPRLKLIRVLANWENRNGTLIAQRSWDGSVYKSNAAFASADVISALQPNTRKLFVVFLTSQGSINIPSAQQIVSISQTNNLFIENGDGSADISSENGKIAPRNSNCLGKGYIIKLK